VAAISTSCTVDSLRAASRRGRKLEADDARDDEADARQSRDCRRLAEQHDAERGSADRSDADPNGLATSAVAVHAVGQKRLKPSVYFRPMAHPTSSRPATINVSQAAVCDIAVILRNPQRH
jgi:hypothetical protein